LGYKSVHCFVTLKYFNFKEKSRGEKIGEIQKYDETHKRKDGTYLHSSVKDVVVMKEL